MRLEGVSLLGDGRREEAIALNDGVGIGDGSEATGEGQEGKLTSREEHDCEGDRGRSWRA